MEPEAVVCPVLPTSVRSSWPYAVAIEPQRQSPATSRSDRCAETRRPCRRLSRFGLVGHETGRSAHSE